MSITTGGLEDDYDNYSQYEHDGTTYIVGNKYRNAILKLITNWNSIIEEHPKQMEEHNLFNFITENIYKSNKKDTNHEKILKDLRGIYEQKLSIHMASMINTYMMNDPLLKEESTLFTILRLHFEDIVRRLLEERNKYVPEKYIINDLLMQFKDIDISKKYNTSSLLLFFINSPVEEERPVLQIKTSDKKIMTAMDECIEALSKFKYPGFCPHVPYERLSGILTFPVGAICNVIHAMNPDAKFPNYSAIPTLVAEYMEKIPNPPECVDNYTRKKTETKDIIKQIYFYIEEILKLRKNAIPCAVNFEKHYTMVAGIIRDMTADIRKIIGNEDNFDLTIGVSNDLPENDDSLVIGDSNTELDEDTSLMIGDSNMELDDKKI